MLGKDCWLKRDKAAVWHPFTQVKTQRETLNVVRGEGSYLYTEDGTRYLDANSSWWVNLHGHAHPYIASKVTEQLSLLEHVIFADVTHPQAIRLAERLLSIMPRGFGKVFYSDNGSTAIEVALKIALQSFQKQKAQPKKIIAFQGGYHGDTFGAMSAAGKNHFNKHFWPFLFEVVSIPAPFYGAENLSIDLLKKELESGDVACFIFEPIVQGSMGMLKHSKEGLSALIKLCHEYGVITIADEVMTGFGRCGPLFASELLDETPKVICLSKGITGGFLPLGATICTDQIFDQFLSDDLADAFLHGHSYTANPLACAAANASLDLLLTDVCTDQRKMIEHLHKEFMSKWQGHRGIQRLDVQGTILAIEFAEPSSSNKIPSYYSSLKESIYNHFFKNNILVRPLGNVLYLNPPYCTDEVALTGVYEVIEEFLTHRAQNPWHLD